MQSQNKDGNTLWGFSVDFLHYSNHKKGSDGSDIDNEREEKKDEIVSACDLGDNECLSCGS